MKRTSIFLLSAALALLVLGGITFTFRERLLLPVVNRLLVKSIGAELGLEITVERISGNYFHDLQLSGVRTISPAKNGTLISVAATTIEARYSLPLLRQGFAAFLGDMHLELDGARVVMDFTRGGTGQGAPSSRSPLVLPVTRARDCTVDLRGRNWALTLVGLDLTVAASDPRQGGIPLTLHASRSVVDLPTLRRQTPELAARGVLTRDSVGIAALEVNGRPVVEAARVAYGPGQPVSFALSFSAFGGSGKAHGEFAAKTTELGWDFREVNVASVATLFALAGSLPGGTVTSRGTLTGVLGDPASLAGEFALKVTDGKIREVPFQHLELAGSSAAGILRLDSLAVAMGRNTASASGVAIPLGALVSGNPRNTVGTTSGRFEARLEDIPALLTLAGLPVRTQHLPGGVVPPHRLVLTGRTSAAGVILDTGTFSGGGGTVALDHCAITWPKSGPILAGLNLSARMSANLPDLGRTATIFGVAEAAGSLQAEATMDGPLRNLKGSLELHGQNLRYRSGGADTLHLVAHSAPAGWRIEQLTAVKGNDRLSGAGTITQVPLGFQDLALELTVGDFHPYLGWFMTGELPPARGRLEGRLQLNGPLAAPEGRFSTRLSAATLAGGAVAHGEVAGSCSGAAGCRLDSLELVSGRDRLSGRGGFALTPLRFNDLALDLKVGDFHPYLGWFMAGELPAARGGLAGNLKLTGPAGAPEGSFGAVLTDASLAGITLTRGELAGTLAGDRLTVKTLTAQGPQGRLDMAGSFRHRAWGWPVTGTIDRLTLGHEQPLLRLLQPVAIRVDDPYAWSFGAATLQGEAGSLAMEGGLSAQQGYDLSLRLSEGRSEILRLFFAAPPVQFRGLNLTGTITGRRQAPELNLAGAVAELRAPEALVPLTGQFDLRISPRGMLLKTFSWSTPAGDQIRLTGTIPYDLYSHTFLPETLAVDGLFAIPDLGVFTPFLPEAWRVPGSLKGTLKISGTGEHPAATIDLHARDLRLPASAPIRPPGGIAVDAVALLKDNDLRLETLTATGKDLNLTVSGKWREAGNLLKERPAGAALPGSLDLRGTFAVDDISWLAQGLPAIRRLGGKVAGTLAIAGEAASPDLSGELSLTEGEFRADSALPPLRDLQAQVSVKQRTATITRGTGSVGGSPFSLSGSVVLPVTGAPQADLRVQGADILLYRSEELGVRADADITIKGSFSAPAFAGTLAITDGKLRKNLNWLEPLRGIGRSKAPVAATDSGGLNISFRNPPLKDATFAIHVVSKNPFLVRSNVARGALRPDLWLRGTGEVPVITGVIYIDPSRVMLPAGRLAIDTGLIRFLEKSPDHPQLEISGSSRILGYDIKVTVEGPYDQPTVTLSSVPPLPQDALLLLLLTGKLPPGAANQNNGWQQGGMNVALYVGKGVITEWFGSNDLDAKETLLDRFEVIIGRGISRQGNETVGAQYRLANGVVREGDELYLVAERDIYDEFNGGIRIVFHFK